MGRLTRGTRGPAPPPQGPAPPPLHHPLLNNIISSSHHSLYDCLETQLNVLVPICNYLRRSLRFVRELEDGREKETMV